MNELEILDKENKNLIEDIIALQKAVMEVELIHYKSVDLNQAKNRNIEYKNIKNFLQDKFDDMYDL